MPVGGYVNGLFILKTISIKTAKQTMGRLIVRYYGPIVNLGIFTVNRRLPTSRLQDIKTTKYCISDGQLLTGNQRNCVLGLVWSTQAS